MAFSSWVSPSPTPPDACYQQGGSRRLRPARPLLLAASDPLAVGGHRVGGVGDRPIAAGAARDPVAAPVACAQHVRAATAVEPVGAGAAAEPIGAGASAQHV